LAETAGLFISYPAYKVDAAIALAGNDGPAALKALGEMSRILKEFNGMMGVEYRDMLADAYQISGDFENAVAVNKEILRVYGGHALSHYELGKLYEEMGQPDEAKAHYSKFLEMWKNADEGLPQPEHARERLAVLKEQI
jgi:tetratricopeptide (TPR) repeat protein